MKALVISGGGSKGAFAGGIAEYLINVCKRDYKIFIGSSTGSLLVPLLSIGNTDKLKHVFTTVTQDDIFNNCPFLLKKKKNVYKTKINHLGIVKMFLEGKKTFGESENLRDLIFKTITESDFELIKKNDVHITVSNLNTMAVEYKEAKDCTYTDFCEWVWASASLVPFMSLVTKNGYEYADGGMGNIVPIYQAIQKGATELDIIVLKTNENPVNKLPIRNALDLTSRVFSFMLNQIVTDDLIIGRLEGMNKKIKLNFYYSKKELTTNSLIFDPVQMAEWWQYGYSVGKENCPDCRTIDPPDVAKVVASAVQHMK
ncbi:patatin-like phospholipase family protein [Ferruginibacter paludis]|jgi:NTE family protein|uniref:patatin-like phospholipase family protein n=1 Tax=Ferruginibacter TaxID=1004303 RepID=UPI0025B5E049|nr:MULTISPECIES: patatin-like phospholipase family protein [Ferruginibacter]MDB5276698.1 patatin [Ferruginibacter sp.]MDN3657392.1 patatin-like phospholipase family protein [Ferruginibacter paludis]